MNKKDLIKTIIILAIVAIFLFEYVSIGMMGGGNKDSDGKPTSQTQYTGTVNVNAVIDYYERALYVTSLNQTIIDELEKDERVSEIEFASPNYIIKINKKEDVQVIYKELMEDGIISYAYVKVVLDPSVSLTTPEGETVKGYFVNRKQKVGPIEPIVPENSTVLLQFQVVIQEENAYPASQITLMSEEKEINGTGVVVEKEYSEVYSIPWEEKNSVDLENLNEMFGEENVQYEENNYVVFSTPLTTDEQLSKKFDYVEYLTAEMALINEDVGKEKLESDFGRNVTLSDSTLVIINNIANLTYEKSFSYIYGIAIESSGYTIVENEKVIAIEAKGNHELNESVNVSIKGVVIGKTIVSVKEIKINN